MFVIKLLRAGQSLKVSHSIALPQPFFIVNQHRWKTTIDYSRYPKLIEEELEEQFVRGSGPGGQAVAKTSNCVVLKHTVTGIIVKCHQTRSLEQNRKIARSLLLKELDELYNKENSVEAQEKRIRELKSTKSERKAEKLRERKKEFKEREGLT